MAAREDAGDRNDGTLRDVPLTNSCNGIELPVRVRSGERGEELGIGRMRMGVSGIPAEALQLHFGRENSARTCAMR